MTKHTSETLSVTDWDTAETQSTGSVSAGEEASATLSTTQGRRALCEACPSLSDLHFCSECSCFIPIKAYIASAECPLGKW